MGDALTVVSTGLYACYTVVMRMKMPGEEAEAHVGLFFGYLGLFNTVGGLHFIPHLPLTLSWHLNSFCLHG